MTSFLSQILQNMNNYDGSVLDNGGTYYFNDTNVTVTMKGLPPAPIVWMYGIVDTICSIAMNYCADWRRHMAVIIGKSTALSSWLSIQNKIPSITGYKPTLLTFEQYCLTQQQHDNSLLSYIQTWYKYAFYSDSTSLGELTSPIALIVVLCFLFPLLRYLKLMLIPYFSKIGSAFAYKTHGQAWIDENQIRIQKFGEYVFRLLFHSLISIYGIYFFRNAIWWSNNENSTMEIFRGYPHHVITPSMAWYYLLQSAYNIDAMITLLQMSFTLHFRSFLRQQPQRASQPSTTQAAYSFPFQFPISIQWSTTVRGDFQEMFLHHIITNGLVIGSSTLRLTRAGSMVFLIHDVSGKSCFT
jgi:TLC domain